ncbi:MAG TPA: arginine--tRNA ligase [Thermoanaerobaculia bacterium]|nr:arginine--tRNA ligase [Thermoanaerobaculia bacterium]
MLGALKRELAGLLGAVIRDLYGIEHEPVVEVPPRRELGDIALPAGLHLARALRKSPRQIAQEIAAAWPASPLVRERRVEGAGYLNLYLDRAAVASRLLEAPLLTPAATPEKVIVEHTNINPNKAAHIGHLRNAVLGDILARSLRALGHRVEIQNYIDDTGVQLADVVVGFADLRRMSAPQVAALPEPFDFYCWDLYAEVGRWYTEDEARQEARRETLHALESGTGERAELGRLIARRVVRRHLGTMRRLGIGYDLLTHESHILGLHFFAAAFERLKAAGAVRLESAGKNRGCWVMPLSESEEFAGLEDPDKVIVRSDGTVTYVGKDIAYQLWKFGLLGRDFAYRYWMEEGVWETALEGAAEHPDFGQAERVVNVIDNRQSYLQKIVRAGLEALGHHAAAERSIHFAYEMVALSPSAARTLGYVSEAEAETQGGKRLEMSGRKGIGVKADDLLDRLVAKSREEIERRNRDLERGELDGLASQIATAALRFFMAKATTTRLIAFDFEEALNFEGESGPYLQYSAVRARNIQRKLRAAGLADSVAAGEAAALPAGLWSDDLWDLVLTAAQSGEVAEKAGSTLELSLLARHALDLAQKFNAIYHQHPILQEPDPQLRATRLAATLIFQRGLEAVSGLLGIPIPDKM